MDVSATSATSTTTAANTISSSKSGGVVVVNTISTQLSIVAAAEFYTIQRTGISRQASSSATHTSASCDKFNGSRTGSRKKYRVRDRGRVRWRSAYDGSVNIVRSSCLSECVNELGVAGGNDLKAKRRPKRYERKIGTKLRFVGDATFCGRKVSTFTSIGKRKHFIVIYTFKLYP